MDKNKNRPPLSAILGPAPAAQSRPSLDEIFQPKPKGLLSEVLDTVDSYTGVPGRQAASTLLDTKNPIKAAGSFFSNFGTDPAQAISSHDLRIKAGIPDFTFREGLEAPEQLAKELWASGADLISPETGSKIRSMPPVMPMSLMARAQPEIVQNISVPDMAVGFGTDWSNVVGGGLLKNAKGIAPAAKSVAGSAPVAKAANVASDAVSAAKNAASTVAGTAQDWWKAAPAAENADDVLSALKGIGVEKPPGFLLTKDKTTQRLADTLIKSPTPGGALVRAEMEPVDAALKAYGKQIAEKSSSLSKFETGKSVSKGIKDSFGKMIEPAEKVYESLETTFKDVPLNQIAMRRGINQLRKKFSTDFTGESANLLNQLEKTIFGVADESGKVSGGIKNVAELRSFRTNLGKYLQGTSSPAAKEIIGEMYGIATRERNRSILGNVLKGKAKLGREARASGLLGDLKGADKLYRESLEKTAAAIGLQPGKRGSLRGQIVSFLEDAPPEEIAKSLFNKGDVQQLGALKQVFPEYFEMLRASELSDVIQKATVNGELSLARVQSQLSKLQPEVQQLLMGELAGKQKQVKTVLESLPPNFNPSDTSTRMEFLDLFRPDKMVQSIGMQQALKQKTKGLIPKGLIKK